MSSRERLLLTSLSPRYPDLAPRREHLAASEAAATTLNDSPDAWFALGDYLMHLAGGIGVADVKTRARVAFERAVSLDSSFAPAFEHLVQIAILQHDTTSVRRLGTIYLSMDSESETAPSIRYSLAAMTGAKEAAALEAGFDTMPLLSLVYITVFGLEDESMARGVGRSISAIESRKSTPGERSQSLAFLVREALNRGRPGEANRALDEWRRIDPSTHGPDYAAVWGALLWDGDSAAASAVVTRLSATLGNRQVTDATGRATQYGDACAVGLWAASYGDAVAAAAARSRISASIPGDSPGRRNANIQCVAMIDAVQSVRERRRDARSRISQLDSLARSGLVSAGFLDEGNVVLARAWQALGEPMLALDAARRQTIASTSGYTTTLALSQARLAAAAGFTRESIDAYRRYLGMRADAEPSLKPEVERVRAELKRVEQKTR